MFMRRRGNEVQRAVTLQDHIPKEEGNGYTIDSFPLRPPLPLPDGTTRDELFDWLKSVREEQAPESIREYCVQDFERFVHTFGLVRRALSGSGAGCRGLELGANPYFTTMLLKSFTDVEWALANYFSPAFPDGINTQRVFHNESVTSHRLVSTELSFQHFNIERDDFPFRAQSFDVILFCEIIEHLLNDPCKVLREIKKVLRPGGTLVLTTPNVNRLENVARLIAGANIYDPYSAHGPYGRHNREYNKHELFTLLEYLGFSVDEIFAADVHENSAPNFMDLSKFGHLIEFRRHDLGQYIFLRATYKGGGGEKRPQWLYRSYPSSELE